MHLLVFTALVFLLVGSSAIGQTLGQYQFNSAVGVTCLTRNVSVTTQPTNASFSTFTNVGGTCVASTTSFVNKDGNDAQTIDLTTYNTFTITPSANYFLTLNSLTLTQTVSANGTSGAAGTSSWVLRSSLDGYVANVGSGNVNTIAATATVNLLPLALYKNTGAVTFRLYLINAKDANTNWTVDNVILNGASNPAPATPANPTTNSPQCVGTGVTLTRSGTVPFGITWYWQTSATDTAKTNSAATLNVTTSGTYYIRARNNTTSLWSSGAGSATVVVTPNVGAVSFTTGSTTRCQGAGLVDYTATASDASLITYTFNNAAAGAINASTGDITYVAGWTGTVIITATATGCGTATTGTYSITTTPSVTTPAFTAGPSTTLCQGAQTITYAATASNTTGITYSLDATSAASNTINATTGAVTYAAGYSGTTTITASAAGCSPKTATFVVTVNPTIGTPVFNASAVAARCQAAGTSSYSATSTGVSTVTYALDANSVTNGNSISASGVVTFAAGFAGTITVTATATGCGGPKTSTFVITTSGPVATPTFTLGTTSNRCQGAGSSIYTANAANNTGLTYSLDLVSSLAGNSINAADGTVTFAALWFGTSTVTVSATGCAGPKTATHTITTNAPVTTPVFTDGANSTRCQGAGTVTYGATAQNTTSITYSLNAASVTGGNSIDPATGTVTYAAGWAGTSTITVTATGCTGTKTATHTAVTTATVGTPVFGLGANSSRCQAANKVTYTATATTNTGITYSLDVASTTGGNTIDLATGEVTYAASWYGTSVITATATGCNGPKSASHTVAITRLVTVPVFSLGMASTVCQNPGAITYTASSNFTTGITYSIDGLSASNGNTIDATTGKVTYSAGWAGTTTITASAAGCSGPQTATHTVTITPTVGVPVFALGSTSARCVIAETTTYSATATTNTGISYTLDATSTAAGNTIDAATGAVTYTATWVGTSIITVTAQGCNGPTTATHTVVTSGPVTAPVFVAGASSTICQAAGVIGYTATSNYTTGITYTLDAVSIAGGNTINATTGSVTYAPSWIGTTSITASAAGCYGPQTSVHTVTIVATVGTPVFDIGAASTRCQGAGNVTYTATATTTTGITYSLDAASIAGGNTIDATTSEVTYATGWSGTTTITASAAGCNGPALATHTVTITPTVGTPVFVLGANSVHCQDVATATYTYTANATNNTGITYSLDATSTAVGNSIDAASGVVTFLASWTGTSIITATATGCNGPSFSSHIVTITPYVQTPVFAIGGSSLRCQGANTVLYEASAIYTSGITYTLDLNSRNGGNTIDATTGLVTYAAGWSGTTTITASAAGCSGPKTIDHVVTITPSVGIPVFALGATSSRCHASSSVTYTATATTNTGISYSLDAASLDGGNTIDPTNGTVTFVNSWVGISVITAAAQGCNGPATSTHTVMTNGNVATPVFDAGATSVTCQNSGSVSYAATATYASGITYKLDVSTTNSGSTINAATGVVTYSPTWFGTSVITATAAGCNGPTVATHIATITRTVSAPIFAAGTASTRCQGAASVTYSATALTSTGITYSLNATSIAGGNTIDAATGEVTYAAGFSGTSIVTASAAGCNGPVTSNHTVTVTATVSNPVFNLGATSVRCQGAGAVTYTATASPTTGITYSLDATSRGAGNVINTTNGAVTFVAAWSGTSVVTASATGCNGPAISTHTITVTPTVGVPVFDLGATSRRCQAAGTIIYTATATNSTTITYTLDATSRTNGNTINATTGEVTYVATWAGTSIITATAAGCNGPRTSTHTVTVTATVGLPVFAKGAATTICHAAATVSYTATATNTTGITYSLDAASLAWGNTIDPTNGNVTYLDSWEGTTVITASAAGCNGPRTSTHTVTVRGSVTAPVFALGSTSIRCPLKEDVTYTATADNRSAGITYTLDAASITGKNKIVSTTGVVSYDSKWTGTSVITASAPGCYGPQTSTHVVTTSKDVTVPVFAAGASSTRCQAGEVVTYSATASNTTAITYTLNAPSITAGNTINPTTGEVTFVAGYSGSTIITASAAGCAGPKTATHTLTVRATVGQVAFSAGAATVRCQGSGTVTYTATATTNTGITYVLDDYSLEQGNSINSANGAVTYSAGFNGTSTITATATGCNGPTVATHTVTVTPTVGEPVFVLGASSTRCRAAGPATFTATATNATSITYSLDATSRSGGNTINATNGTVTFAAAWSGTSTITASAAGCNGPDLSTHVVVTTPPITTPVFTLGTSSTRCQGAGTASYVANSNNDTTMTYSLNAAAITGGNSINATTGVVTYAANWTGATIIMATANGCGGPLSATHTVTITTTTSTPVFAAGASSVRCNGTGTVSYTATAASTIVYSLDAASISGGNTINSSTGAVTFVGGWVGNTIVTAQATGCGTPTATHTITLTPSVSAPVFAAGASSSRCQGAGSITYTASSSNSTGITYSLDAASLAGGNTINAATGEVTYVDSWSTTATITATATGCNGPATSLHTVSINGNGTPTFVLGSSSTRVQAAEIVTYTAASNNGGTVSYTMDAASTAAGNSINPATGAVTYVVGWSGTTIITASSTGCIGVVSSTHTVTVTPSSVIKSLYLSDPTQALDRIDPVATNDLTTANSAILANGGTITFTQSPVLCSPLTIKVGRSIVITTYLTINSGTMPTRPAITAVLKHGTTNIISINNPTYTSATGLLTWTAQLGADFTVPAGQAVALTISTAQAGVTFTINYDSKTKPSKIDLPVSTFIDITSLDVYNAPYPGGTPISGAVTGTRSYIRATVTDPFGFNDITGMDVTITPTGSTVASTSVATAGCTRTYEYVWNSPATANYMDITVRAKEGFENTVSATRSIAFSNCTACPPRAYDDSAVGAGGTPITIDVLANDTDPNNNLNPAALTIVSAPQNGNVFVSNGEVIYLPNGTFTGADEFTYQICDLTSPTPLCATAVVKVFIDPTIVDPCSETSQSHIYYIPYPEQDVRTALIASSNASVLPIPSNNIRTIISVKVPYPGMRITWDHWEDGYEANILNPTQTTTKIWGDGNPYNGIAPGYPSDIIPSGGSFVFDNTMPASPRVAANIFYDGKDKIEASGEISITQVSGEPSIIGVQCMKTNVSSTADFGKSFTIPVGQNFNSQDFRYTALFIRASENNTLVRIDKDNNGTFETTATLSEGQSLLVNGGVMTGATVTGSAPIGVDLHFGGVDNYSSREVPIYPATWYSNVYYTPVPTTNSANPSVVMFYNNLNRAITINWTSGAPASGTINLPAKTAIRYQLALSTTNTYKFVNLTGESFTAIEIVDSYAPGGGTSGPDFDWSFNLIAEDRLTTFATLAWAPGSTDKTRNDNPIWVTPANNTTIYVKYDGDVTTGGFLSPCGFRYNVAYTVNALKYRKILDTDNDQSGIAIYTCDGTKIAAVYGEDPSTAALGNPSWDVGTTIKPYCATKLIFANDDYAYSLTDRAVTIQILSNDAGFTAVLDPSTVTVSGGLQPKHGTVKVNANGTLLYTPNAGYIGLDSLEYTVCSTPSPVCDRALVIIKINGCPTPANQNILSGQVFLDKNKDGVRNDGNTGFAPAKVYLYADGDCDGVIDVNELKDSVVVDSSGTYQFITYPERIISDNFDAVGGASSTCATGTDGNTPWKSNWVDAGDAGGASGVCASATGDAEVVKDGAFSYALRLMDNNVSATRTININGASAAFLSFSYRRATASLTTGRNIIVQASSNGTTFSTIYTIEGDGTTDANYVQVLNQDILPYAGTTTTYIRFLTNNSVGTTDIVYIDDISITYLKFPICYITAIDAATVPSDYYISTASQNSMTASNGGTCLFPFDFGMAKKIITISGTLYNDVNGLTDNLVNGIGTGAPSGNTVYAYLVNTAGVVEFKTTLNSLTGVYSFANAEVTTDYTVVLSTTDVAIGAVPPPSNLPAGWVTTGDAYGTINNAGTGNETGTPNLSIPVKTGLFGVTGVNFGIEQRPGVGSGSNTAINPGGTTLFTVPVNTFNNLASSSDVSPGVITSIRITAFPNSILTLVVNNVTYTAANFPAAGLVVPANSAGQPTQTIQVDPLNGSVKVNIPFFTIDNAGFSSLASGLATLQFLMDTDKDGVPDINDIDDDNDGIPDVIEICGNGATSFACAPGGKDPAADNDGDGISNWQDADYGPLNANGANAALDRDGDGVPDFLDLDSDNDGVPDVVEAYGVDTDGNGIIDNFTDTDGDGLSQNVDGNNTGAAGSGVALGFIDLDGDGIPNSLDLDSDNDGIPDILEVLGTDANNDGRVDGFVDTDGDGLANSVDGDADGNGTIENTSGPLLKTGPSLTNNGKASNYPTKNADYTGKPNLYDLDSDGDGITDVIEAGFPGSIGVSNGQVSGGKTNGWANSIQLLSQITLRNSDGRGPANFLDIDSDDDGITDNIEAQSTNGYRLPTDIDTDGDGLADVYELSSGLFGANGLTPFDNDGDGTPDYMDTDTDNDGAPDINEASRLFNLTQANINTADLDNDGLIDEFDMLNITQLAAGGIYRNMTNSNFGALGTLSGPSPSGSNVQIVKSAVSMNDRDWRNIVVLPLQIVSFTGTYQNNLVTLQWLVKNEGDVSQYEIERSPNGIDFAKIATVKALNRQNNTYTYADDISSVSLTNVYYRIRQVEKTGETSLTNVIRWKIENSNEQPVLYPNPVQTDLKIKYVSKVNGTVDVMISDAKGQPVSTAKFSVVQGQNILTLPRVGSMSKGSYMLRFHSGLNTWMLRFLVQ
jgi:hypothetical protein